MKTIESSPNFKHYWLIVKRRWLSALTVFVSVFVLLSIVAIFKKPTYLAEGKLKFERTNTTSTLTGVGTEIGKLEPLVQDKSNPLYTEAEVIRSVPVVNKTLSTLKLKDEHGLPLKSKVFLKRLTVKESTGADVLDISFKDMNPGTAAKVVNTIMAIYLEHNISAHRAQAAAARKFLEKQVPNAELIVRKAEAELARFKEKYQVVSLQEEVNQAVGIIAELQKQISATQYNLANVDAQSQAIRKQLGMNAQYAVTMTSLSQSSGVQDLLKEIQQLESQLAAKGTVLQDDHPQIIDLKEKLKSLKELLQQRITMVAGTTQPQPNQNFQLGLLQQQLSGKLVELESTRLGLANQVNTLFRLQTAYKERLNNLPRLEQYQRQLERKVQAAQSTYSLLLQKLQESQIAENQNVGNASLISPAEVPEEPTTSLKMLYLIAGLLSSIAALASVYVLEARDKSIKTVDEAKELLDLTLLGIIPVAGKPKKALRGYEELELDSQKIVVRDTPRSPMSEAYRMLRANLKFMNADKELKVIVVTSSVPKEGKSTVATNLAVAMAQTERKVLLIDGDLHRPTQHKIWGLTNSQGLSNLIVGQAEIKKAIKNVMDNLDVLTSGVVPPSPASLLDSKRMAALMETFVANYDFVIVDAPSLNVAADAATLGQMADGVLFVVRPGVVDAVNAAFAKELLEKSGQNVLGQVVNGVISQNEPYSYYYFTEEDYPQPSIRTQESGSLVKY
ncbi:polysaccharide biosynthesis tyrosine autokinase [Nostocaceae cyanobacterium CENA369]|uniref:non-specific protein-tyrosine kinase n=1 Tax=Dendronalium phyllosphericum CENA369 TaxID=1725256 RepID=A0A8J7I064_9NOST|nr:polysaccharide biosynthesis tyrosine autokinase [Dendronalium phyllosphericum]MBH8571668.1 polysaccharide biosynthesis tyrosine autokinase [Dendronalium phyllosphericum CENA369]